MTAKKLIIDTDPGIDDVLAIMMAFASTDCEVLGLTTCYGNVPTTLATKNALILTERLGHTQVRIIHSSSTQSHLSHAMWKHGQSGILARCVL